MQITFISPTVNLSGGIRVIVIYAQRLVSRGHVVRIISPPPRRVPFKFKAKSWLKGGGWPSDVPRLKSHLDDSGVDHRLLDRWRPVTDDDVPDGDIVIATWWETAEWVNALAPSKGVKVYFIQHHEIFDNLPIARCGRTYLFPMHKIVVARWLKDVMGTEYKDRLVDVVPNSVDRSQFFGCAREKQAVPTIGFLYSYHPFKGLDVTLAAARIVRERFPDLRVISFGDTLPTVELPFPEGTEFSLSPSQDHLRNLYTRCDIWVTASRSEGFNLTALEAMACRTPVVATRTGWPEEGVKTGWNGVLVDIDDVRGLAQGVEWVLSRSDEDWRALSSNAAETATSGSWELSAELFEKALHHACLRSARGEVGGKCTVSLPK
jgi:glycosyltransferase involved in cell wall biosynthesis